MASWWQQLFGRPDPPSLDPARADLVVVASSFDDTEACSTAFERAAGLEIGAPVVLRHHLRIPAQHLDAVCQIAAQDGYAPVRADTPGTHELESLTLQRVQVLDVLHCSQERARMAGLAQRHDGTVDGWDALQPGSATEQRR